MDAGALIILTVVVVAVLAAVAVKSVTIVSGDMVGLVERLGKYRRTLQPGLSVIIPFVETVRTVRTGEQVLPVSPIHPLTSDSQTVVAEPVLHVEVVDPIRATYEIADYVHGLESLTEVTVRSAVEGMDLTRALQGRYELQQLLSRTLEEAAESWGIRVNRVELGEIRPAA